MWAATKNLQRRDTRYITRQSSRGTKKKPICYISDYKILSRLSSCSVKFSTKYTQPFCAFHLLICIFSTRCKMIISVCNSMSLLKSHYPIIIREVSLCFLFLCKTPPATFSISGKVTLNPSHIGLAGVTMILSGNANATTLTDAGGNYSFTGLAPGIYTVPPSRGGYRFGPPEKKKNRVLEADVTGINFNAMVIKKTAPGAMFGGFLNVPSDPGTTVQVMGVAVNTTSVNAGRPLRADRTYPVVADGVTLKPRAATNPTALVLP